MAGHGSFSGNPKTEWLVDANDADRNMQLIEDFWYVDPNNKKWNAPAQSIINGASIPRPLWSSVGSPYTDDYRRASIVHDVACHTVGVDRKDADVMFYHACLAGGCSFLQAKWLYAGVRIGAWSDKFVTPKRFSKGKLLFQLSSKLRSDEQFIQSKFHELVSEISTEDEASIEQLDALIDKHIKL